MPQPFLDPRWNTAEDHSLQTADIKIGPVDGLVEQGAMMYRRGQREARDLVVLIGRQGREHGTTIALNTLLDWMPEADLRAALDRRERMTTVLEGHEGTIQKLRGEVERLKAQRLVLVEWAEYMSEDPDQECRFDHHGACQSHGGGKPCHFTDMAEIIRESKSDA